MIKVPFITIVLPATAIDMLELSIVPEMIFTIRLDIANHKARKIKGFRQTKTDVREEEPEFFKILFLHILDLDQRRPTKKIISKLLDAILRTSNILRTRRITRRRPEQ